MTEQENATVAMSFAALSLDGPDTPVSGENTTHYKGNGDSSADQTNGGDAPKVVAGPPSSPPARPPEGGDFADECNLFVGDLARSVTEDQLSEIFGQHGEVVNVEIKRDRYTHNSLGYGFVQFKSRADAAAAKKALHRTPIGNRAVRIGWAQKNTNLFVGDLDSTITTAQLREAFSQYGPIYQEETFVKGRNFGFVRFKHRVHAEAAKRSLDGTVIVEGTKAIRIGWGDNNFQKSCVHVQFALGENEVMNEEVLRDAFQPFGNVTSVTLPRNNQTLKGFGFVHFEDTDEGEEAATTAIQQLSGEPIGPSGVVIQCNFGKRQSTKTRQNKKLHHGNGNPMYHVPMMLNIPGAWPGQPMQAYGQGARMGPNGQPQPAPYGQGGHDQTGQMNPMVPMAYMYPQGMPPNAYQQQMYMQGYQQQQYNMQNQPPPLNPGQGPPGPHNGPYGKPQPGLHGGPSGGQGHRGRHGPSPQQHQQQQQQQPPPQQHQGNGGIPQPPMAMGQMN